MSIRACLVGNRGEGGERVLASSEEASWAGFRQRESTLWSQGTRRPLVWEEPSVGVLLCCVSRLVACRRWEASLRSLLGK